MMWNSDKTRIRFSALVYYSDSSKTYIISTYNKTNYNDNSSYFMAGRTTWNNYKFLQFGVKIWA